MPINYIQSSMLTPTMHLFEEITSATFFTTVPGYLLNHSFTVNGDSVLLYLTDHFILLADAFSKTPTHFCKLGFEVKFEVIYQLNEGEIGIGIPVAIKIEKENCYEQLTFSSQSAVVEIWSIQLEKKINQRNFHKLFKAKKKIGKGAFATVYLAERLRDHKMVAVKAFSKEKQYSGDKGRESLENEIKLMRRLNHENIMKLEGVYETENSIYVILEYFEGPQLNEILKSGKKLTHDEVKVVLKNLLRGLSHLAKHKIIHRDLKPENIMFKNQTDMDLAICDFGLATYADEEKYLFVRCGTPGFVAPQIINIRDMSTKSLPISDVFSAGVIFHYLLFGYSVFEGKKYNEILSQNRSCSFNFQKQTYTKLSSRTFDLLTKMLERDPTKRITADAALAHTYFTCEMEIEDIGLLKSPLLLKEISSPNVMSVSNKKQIETPSVLSKNRQKMFYDKQNRNPYLYS